MELAYNDWESWKKHIPPFKIPKALGYAAWRPRAIILSFLDCLSSGLLQISKKEFIEF